MRGEREHWRRRQPVSPSSQHGSEFDPAESLAMVAPINEAMFYIRTESASEQSWGMTNAAISMRRVASEARRHVDQDPLYAILVQAKDGVATLLNLREAPLRASVQCRTKCGEGDPGDPRRRPGAPPCGRLCPAHQHQAGHATGLKGEGPGHNFDGDLRSATVTERVSPPGIPRVPGGVHLHN